MADLGAVASAGGSLLGGVLGSIFSSGDSQRASQLYQDAYNEAQNIGLPPDQRDRFILQQFNSAGMYTPGLEKVIAQGPSAFQSVQSDPALKSAQMQALGALAQRGQGGMNPEDIAAYNQLRNKAAADQQANQQAILQAAQRRGQNVDGQALMASLISSQQGANQQMQGGDDISAQASRNALQAMSNYGTQAGQIRGQDFSEASAKAQAADAINRFNAQAAMQTQAANVGAQNQGQMYNLQNQQQINNANTNLQNNETYNQAQRANNYWNQGVQRAGIRSGADTTLGNNYAGAAANTRQNWLNIGTGVGQIAGAALGAGGGGGGGGSGGGYTLSDNLQSLLKQNVGKWMNQPSEESEGGGAEDGGGDGGGGGE